MTPDIVYDQLIGAGCARKLIFSWGGNPGVGSLHRFRDAVQNAWPSRSRSRSTATPGMANRYVAGASGLPFAVMRGYNGTDLPEHTDDDQADHLPVHRRAADRGAGARASTSAIIHAQRADREGNVQLWGLTGVQKETVLGAKRSLVTVEEIVDELDAAPERGRAAALGRHPRGARCRAARSPSYAHDYYERDNASYREWDAISKDRDAFDAWLEELREGCG